MLQEKQFYLDQLKDGPIGHRKIAARMSERFKISPTIVRDALIKEGLIKLHDKKYIGNTQRFNYFYRLTNKPVVEMQQETQTIVVEKFWPDGWPKSQDNAFNWRGKEQQIFSKAQLAQMQQKQTSNNSTNVYSRA